MPNKPTDLPEWLALETAAKNIQSRNITDYFDNDAARVSSLSFSASGVMIDFSKQWLTHETAAQLCALARAMNIEEKRDAMFTGDAINHTEKRAVLHTALRGENDIKIDGDNIRPAITGTLDRIKTLADNLHAGKIIGANGKPIKHIISIGVGGSDLGPRLVCDAIKNDNAIDTHFIANIDYADLERVLKQVDIGDTLFIIVSKSFGTQETLTNAETIKEKLLANGYNSEQIASCFYAVTANAAKARSFGIKDDHIFPMWDWVNGRFSVWSAVGLAIALQNGFECYKQLLQGAAAADKHFKETPLEQNIPVLMGLIGIWNNNFLNFHYHAVMPYAQRLQYFPDYIQQLDMESNGKTIDQDGDLIIDYQTCPIVFGDVGTNGQHSFYQLLHQGSFTVPCDFIGFINGGGNPTHHQKLMNNMLAQGQAMMQGRQDNKPSEPFRYFTGNKPNTTILLDRLDAYHLGMLMAFYEHKVFTQGVIWNINSFDQFGVELGKELSQKIEQNDMSSMDQSTLNLYSYSHKNQ